MLLNLFLSTRALSSQQKTHTVLEPLHDLPCPKNADLRRKSQMRHQLIFVIAQNAKLLGFVGAGGRQERAHRMGLFQHTHTEAKPSQALYWGSGQRAHRRSPWVAQMATTRGWRSRALQVGRRLWARPKETHPRWVVGLGSGLRRIENATFKKWLFYLFAPCAFGAEETPPCHRLGVPFLFQKQKRGGKSLARATWAKIGQKQGILAIFKTFPAPSNPVRLPPPKPPACGCSAMEWAPPTPTPGGCTCPSYLSAPALTPQGPHFWIIPQQKPSPQTAKKSGWANGLREDCEGRDQGIAGVLRGASALRSWRRKCV